MDPAHGALPGYRDIHLLEIEGVAGCFSEGGFLERFEEYPAIVGSQYRCEDPYSVDCSRRDLHALTVATRGMARQ